MARKKLVTILELVLKEFRLVEKKFYSNGQQFKGLCYLAKILESKGVLTLKDEIRFRNLLNKTHKDQEVFYTSINKVIYNNNQFHWKVGLKAPRERWLKGQIKRLS